jgi:2-phospho-L-lactate guanylyltransferase (CobY/MobA/RfbA family)
MAVILGIYDLVVSVFIADTLKGGTTLILLRPRVRFLDFILISL